MSWVRSLNMDNICYLFDSFAFHYHRGIAFLSEQDFLATRNNLIYATEILLKIANSLAAKQVLELLTLPQREIQDLCSLQSALLLFF